MSSGVPHPAHFVRKGLATAMRSFLARILWTCLQALLLINTSRPLHENASSSTREATHRRPESQNELKNARPFSWDSVGQGVVYFWTFAFPKAKHNTISEISSANASLPGYKCCADGEEEPDQKAKVTDKLDSWWYPITLMLFITQPGQA